VETVCVSKIGEWTRLGKINVLGTLCKQKKDEYETLLNKRYNTKTCSFRTKRTHKKKKKNTKKKKTNPRPHPPRPSSFLPFPPPAPRGNGKNADWPAISQPGKGKQNITELVNWARPRTFRTRLPGIEGHRRTEINVHGGSYGHNAELRSCLGPTSVDHRQTGMCSARDDVETKRQRRGERHKKASPDTLRANNLGRSRKARRGVRIGCQVHPRNYLSRYFSADGPDFRRARELGKIKPRPESTKDRGFEIREPSR